MRSKGPAPLLFLKADYRNVSFIQNAGGKMGIFEIYKDRIGEYRWRFGRLTSRGTPPPGNGRLRSSKTLGSLD